jgi:hypothetical protein
MLKPSVDPAVIILGGINSCEITTKAAAEYDVGCRLSSTYTPLIVRTK